MNATKITGIGAAVYDTLIQMSVFPVEDTKTDVVGIRESGGGPCATGLVAAARLGATVSWLGVLADDPGGKFLFDDFVRFGVSTNFIDVKAGFRSFSARVILTAKTASRTCLLDRGTLPKLELDERKREEIRSANILMVDGNELPAALDGAKTAREAGVKILYDAGAPYKGVEELLPLVDILIPSESFALSQTGKENALEAAIALFQRWEPEVVVVTCGSRGGVCFDGEKLTSWSAFPVEVVDSNGAGDVFHGAFALAVARGFSYEKCCIFSSAVSALKCTGLGARHAVPDFNTTLQFLKERGYDNEL